MTIFERTKTTVASRLTTYRKDYANYMARGMNESLPSADRALALALAVLVAESEGYAITTRAITVACEERANDAAAFSESEVAWFSHPL